jgi:hypothetical protein
MLNTLNPSSCTSKYDQIAKAFPKPPTIVIIDSIYKVTGGIDLAKAEAALSLIQFSDRLMSGFGCAVLMSHHFHREGYTVYGKKIQEDDAYYGHSFIKNHMEVSYIFRPLDRDGSRGQLQNRKKREDNVLDTLELVYHPETYTCSMLPQPTQDGWHTKIETFLSSCKDNPTDFYEVKAKTGISAAHLRRIQEELVHSKRLKIQTSPGQKSRWYYSG